eukprot:355903-Chlamydomonas_euryale.AAC.3
MRCAFETAWRKLRAKVCSQGVAGVGRGPRWVCALKSAGGRQKCLQGGRGTQQATSCDSQDAPHPSGSAPSHPQAAGVTSRSGTLCAHGRPCASAAAGNTCGGIRRAKRTAGWFSRITRTQALAQSQHRPRICPAQAQHKPSTSPPYAHCRPRTCVA